MGNRFTNVDVKQVLENLLQKVERQVDEHADVVELMSTDILGNIFNIVLPPECSQLGLQLCQKTKQGIAMKLRLHCSCD